MRYTNSYCSLQSQRKIDAMKKYILFTVQLLCLVGVGLLSSCGSSREIVYFQDLQPGKSEITLPEAQAITVQPEDKITIVVNSRDPQLANLFNLPVMTRTVGQIGQGSGTSGISGYTVDAEGNIDFPVLGTVHVGGKTRMEIASAIKEQLIQHNLIKDPLVTVEFMNLTVTVMGEVNSPGRYSIDKDRVTLLDALGMAGDLTIYGKRENVLVMREEGGVQRVYGVNLCSGEQLYTSPVYYLRQNDVVYVEPNSMRARQSTVNGNNVRSTSFWLSLASFLTSIGILIFR